MQIREVGPQLERLAIKCDSFVDMPLLHQSSTKADVRHRVLRSQSRGFAKVRDGRFRFTMPVQQNTKVVGRREIMGAESQSLLELSARFLKLPLFAERRPHEIMQLRAPWGV